MGEWWTYSPSDLVMYSAGTYLRLIGTYNHAVWPAQAAALVASIVIVVSVLVPKPRMARIAFVLSSLACAVVAVAWFFARFATIQTFARWFGTAFLVEAGLLLWLAFRPPAFARLHGRANLRAILIVTAFVGYPLLGLWTGRSLDQVELFALMPTPTALATLAVLSTGSSAARIAHIIPVIWLTWDAMSSVTLGLREGVFIALTGLAFMSIVAIGRIVMVSDRVRRPD